MVAKNGTKKDKQVIKCRRHSRLVAKKDTKTNQCRRHFTKNNAPIRKISIKRKAKYGFWVFS